MGSEHRPVAGSYEHGKELHASINGVGLHTQLGDYLLLQKGFISRSRKYPNNFAIHKTIILPVVYCSKMWSPNLK
jgi:hypothetical protein